MSSASACISCASGSKPNEAIYTHETIYTHEAIYTIHTHETIYRARKRRCAMTSRPNVRIRHILCPVDFSEASVHALEYGIGLASSIGARITALHVYEIPTYTAPEMPFTANLEWMEQVREHAAQELRTLVARYDGEEVEVTGELREGRPFREIPRAAQEKDADLVVMGTHGRTGLSHWLMGSVAERVVRVCSAPVLTVRHPDDKRKHEQDGH
jgi:nucleotide-binding universal stress UspA family protein